MTEAFERWKKGFLRQDKDSGKLFFCDPRTTRGCGSSKDGINACRCNGDCDRLWREKTGYHGKMLEPKEVVSFT
jgi:hypothetical protein